MEIKVIKISRNELEELEIRCHEMTEQVREIIISRKYVSDLKKALKGELF